MSNGLGGVGEGTVLSSAAGKETRKLMLDA